MYPHCSSGTAHVSRQLTSSNAESHDTGEKLKIIFKNVSQIFYTFIHNSFSRCRYIYAYVLYDTVHFKKTHAAVKGAEKFHYTLAFETHCIILTTVYDSHEINYRIILEYYKTRH